MAVTELGNIVQLIGLTSDTKPSGNTAGSTFLEQDSGAEFVWTGTTWFMTKASNGAQLIQNGLVRAVNLYTEVLGDDGTISLLIRTGSLKNLNIIATSSLGGDGSFSLTTDMTIGTPTTAPTILNRKAGGATTSDATFFTVPDDTGGTPINIALPGGDKNVTIGSTQEFNLIQLAPDLNFLFRLTNLSGTDQIASLTFNWYEVAI